MSDVILFNPIGWKAINDRFMPFALLYSAIYVHKEYDVKIIDQRFEKDWENKLKKELKKKKKNYLCWHNFCYRKTIKILDKGI